MQIKGKIIAVLEYRSGVSERTGNSWASQDYVLETHDQYPRKCCFNVYGEEKIKNFNINVGDEMTIDFDIDAKERTTKDGRTFWTNEVRAWRAVHEGQQAPVKESATKSDTFPNLHPGDLTPTENLNEVPF